MTDQEFFAALAAIDCDGYAIIQQWKNGPFIGATLKGGALSKVRTWDNHATPAFALIALRKTVGELAAQVATPTGPRTDGTTPTVNG